MGARIRPPCFFLVAEVAREIGRRFNVLFIDLEAQYGATIDHVSTCREAVSDVADFIWVALPLALRNACSVFEPSWTCWDPKCPGAWVREPPADAVTDPSYWDWFSPGMEFEEFVRQYEGALSGGQPLASLVGIRTAESLNRWRTIAQSKKSTFRGKRWTTWRGGGIYSVFPIYDWRTEDVWTYHARAGAPVNRIYDLMQSAGVPLSKQRLCQPYGDDQRQGLWLFQILEPETWPRVLSRVAGANSGARYSRARGNIQGRGKVTKPPECTWEEYSKSLLALMPASTREHYELKIDAFISWYQNLGWVEIPDEANPKEESSRRTPSWRRIAKTILKNDFACKSLGFAPHKSRESYIKWKRLKKT